MIVMYSSSPCPSFYACDNSPSSAVERRSSDGSQKRNKQEDEYIYVHNGFKLDAPRINVTRYWPYPACNCRSPVADARKCFFRSNNFLVAMYYEAQRRIYVSGAVLPFFFVFGCCNTVNWARLAGPETFQEQRPSVITSPTHLVLD